MVVLIMVLNLGPQYISEDHPSPRTDCDNKNPESFAQSVCLEVLSKGTEG